MTEAGERDAGLTAASRAGLLALLRAIETGTVSCPLSASALQFAGMAHLTGKVRILDGLSAEAVAAALRIAIAERDRSAARTLELVWTGPEGATSSTRDTAVVLRELLASARESVLIAGYAFDHGEELLRPLHEAMRDRGVTCQIVLDIPRMVPPIVDSTTHARAAVARFVAANWAFGEPFPEFFYDPRTALPGATESMHAKCVVVDESRTLLTSANFTDRGRTRNVECGVVIGDPAFARMVLGQWRGLMAAGALRRVASP